MINSEYKPKGIRVTGDTWDFWTIIRQPSPAGGAAGPELDLTNATVTMIVGAALLTATGVKADQTSEMGRVSFAFTPQQTATLATYARNFGFIRYRIRVVFSETVADTVGSGGFEIRCQPSA